MPVPKVHEPTKFSVGVRDVTNLIDADNLLPVEAGFFSPEITCLSLAPDFEDDVSCFPFGTLVSLAFKDDFVSFRHTRQDIKGILRSVIHDLCTTTMVANLSDDFTLTAALVTTEDNTKGVRHKLHIA